MEFIDLKKQYSALKKEIDANIQAVLNHGRFILGPEVAQLEQELAEYVGVRHCIGCANGTDALAMALMALNIGKGDAVFVPTFTFMSSAEVIALRGATPVFCDINADTFNLDSNSLKSQMERIKKDGTLKPKAIVAVDLFGQCADYRSILPIAKENNLLVIEDGAQGFGGSIDGKRACSFGDISTTSFFPAKPLGCYGDGGAVFTDNEEYAALLSSIRVHGKGTMKYDNVRIGLNSRLDTLQAAILLPKLHAFKKFELDARNKWARLYTEALQGTVKTPFVPDGFVSSWAQYSILLSSQAERDALQQKLKSAGVPSMVYYPKPLHQQTAFASLGCKQGDFPVAEETCKRILNLPMHPYMDEDSLKVIVDVIRQ